MKGWLRKRGWFNDPKTAYMPMIPLPADCAKHGGGGDAETCAWCLLNRLFTYEDDDEADRNIQ